MNILAGVFAIAFLGCSVAMGLGYDPDSWQLEIVTGLLAGNMFLWNRV